MKVLKFSLNVLVLVVAVLFVLPGFAQTKAQKKATQQAEIKQLLESKKYLFVAESAIPMSGRFIPLTSPYDLFVNKDSLVCFLPYFGRAFVAPMDPTKNSLDFTSVNYTYKSSINKKGMYEISIKPNDVNDPRMLNLSVSPSGNASLTVTSTNRQPISFEGYISAKDKKKK